MMSVLALSRNPLIPDDHGVHLALSCHVLARYVCENQICVPVVKRCQIGLEVKGERQGIFVVVAIIEKGIEFLYLEGFLD